MTDEKFMRLSCHQKAQKLWAEFTDNEKTGCRFGLFPGVKMKAAIEEGYDVRELSLALMACAAKDGGMKA